MSRQKLKKFAKARILPNIFLKDFPEDKNLLKQLIKKYDRVFLELGAGRGEYTLFLAQKHPGALCIAVDIKSDRLLYGARESAKKGLLNAVFLRENIENIKSYLPKGRKVNKIWLPFPDPFPKKRHEKHRLTNPYYLKIYKKILHPTGKIFLKTDNELLFNYSLDKIKEFGGKILKTYKNLLKETYENELLLETRYQTEALNKGKNIFLIEFTF